MFNKLKFNNLVITNKKKIQQGYVQTVHKLVQKIRKTNSLLEAQPSDMKLKERLRKYIAIMEQLKKFKPIDIIRKILVLDKRASTFLTNCRSTPEEVAIAMLAMNKVLVNLINMFREELALNDKIPEWKIEIMQTSKRRTKIEKTEEKRKKRKDLKTQKAKDIKRLEWLQANQPISNGVENNDNHSNCETSADVLQSAQTTKVNITETPQKERDILPIKKICKTKVQNNVQPKHTTKRKIPKNNENGIDADCHKLTHVVDPFFITEQGENYLSTAVVVDTESEELDGMHNLRQYDNNGLKKRRGLNFSENRSKVPESSIQRVSRLENRHSSWGAKLKQKPTVTPIAFGYSNELKKGIHSAKTGNNNINHTPDQSAENLHPSWAAKLKMKAIISPFQGKKITFHIDDS